MGPPTTRYRAVLLDALGTLVELEPPWPLLLSTLRARHGIEVSEQQARRAMEAEMAYYRQHHTDGRDARSLADLRRRCAQALRDSLPEVAPLADSQLTEVLLDALRFTPWPDAASALAQLREAGLRQAVVSNWDCSLRSVLARVGLAGAVNAVVTSAEVGAEKPRPEIFRAALAELRCEAGDALFVGDSPEVDVAGARAAGLRAILLDRHDRHPSEPHRVFSLAELPELVSGGNRTASFSDRSP